MIPAPVLMVENCEEEALLARRAFERLDQATALTICAEADAALRVLRESATWPALVLVDLNLGTSSGVDLLRLIRADPRLRDLPVLMLTSSGRRADRRAAYAAGANGFLQKPIDFQDFCRLLQRTLDFWLECNLPPPAPEEA